MLRVLTLCASLSLAAADPPKGPAVEVFGAPAPAAAANAPTALDPGKFLMVTFREYVGPVEWDVSGDVSAVRHRALKPKTLILATRQGTAAEDEYESPDGPGATEFVRGVSPGTVRLVAWGVKDNRPVRVFEMVVAVGPRPPPGPQPGPDPGPTPQPDPTPDDPSPFVGVSGLHVLMTFDAANTTRPAAEQSVLYGKKVRDWLDANCARDGTGEANTNGRAYRIYPTNSDVSLAPKVWADAFGKAGGKEMILIGDGRRGYVGPLPKTEADALALLKKHGGN